MVSCQAYEHPERVKKIDKQIVKQLNYDRIEFPVQEKGFDKTEMMNNVCINVFAYENKLVLPFMFQIKILKTQWFYCCLKMVIILIMCTSKILTDLCSTKQKIKIKSGFVEVVQSVLVVKIF